MILNASNAAQMLNSIFANLKTTFNQRFNNTPSVWDQVAMEVPSTGRANDYAWLGDFPKMRKWIGDKVIKQLTAHGYTLVNDDFEATVRVKRNDIEDDNLGIYKPQAEMAGESAKTWADELVFDTLTRGFVEKCYDGQPFYSANHLVGQEGAQKSVSNLIDKALSADSLAKAKASYGAARTMMRSLKDDEGRPLNLMPSLLVVPPALEDVANALMTVDRLEDGKPNPYKGTAKVLVVGWLRSDTEWHLLDTTKAIKPIVFQPRKKPVFVQQTDINADDVFNRAEFKFGAEARGAAGYGFWQMAVGSTGTVA